MGFVRSREEIAQIQTAMAENRFLDVAAVAFQFETTREFVEHVLPPGLEPRENLVSEVRVIEVGRSNCVGPFLGGGLYVPARHGDREGHYCPWLPMETDAAITWGRELFGEPKKQATVEFERDGKSVRGRVERYGDVVLDIRGTLTEEEPPGDRDYTVFHYKDEPAVDGQGFAYDPQLIAVDFESEVRARETGEGSADMATTTHCPLGTVPVAEELGVAYTEVDLATSQELLTTVDPAEFLPYAYGLGRVDDWLELSNVE